MIEVYFDGACEPINPGGTASCGWLIKKDGRIIAKNAKVIGSGRGITNNVAEYQGLIEALKHLSKLKIKEELKIYSDSNLVCNIVAKNWGWNKKKTKWQPHKQAPHLRLLLDKVLKLLAPYQYQINWIPREKNYLSDTLSKQVLVQSGII